MKVPIGVHPVTVAFVLALFSPSDTSAQVPPAESLQDHCINLTQTLEKFRLWDKRLYLIALLQSMQASAETSFRSHDLQLLLEERKSEGEDFHSAFRRILIAECTAHDSN